jgi:hypothetical protein
MPCCKRLKRKSPAHAHLREAQRARPTVGNAVGRTPIKFGRAPVVPARLLPVQFFPASAQRQALLELGCRASARALRHVRQRHQGHHLAVPTAHDLRHGLLERLEQGQEGARNLRRADERWLDEGAISPLGEAQKRPRTAKLGGRRRGNDTGRRQKPLYATPEHSKQGLPPGLGHRNPRQLTQLGACPRNSGNWWRCVRESDSACS